MALVTAYIISWKLMKEVVLSMRDSQVLHFSTEIPQSNPNRVNHSFINYF